MAAGSSPAANAFNFKVVVLGEGCVGKTSLVLRYVEDKFNDEHISTLKATFWMKKINVNGKRVNLSFWDTAGQEKFHALGPIYYRASNGAVLVYDITDQDTFSRVQKWVKELRKMLGADICLVIAGNKTDLERDRHVSIEEAEQYAKQVGATHWQTSAKLNSGIEEMFLSLTQSMIEKAAVSEQSNRGKGLIVDDDQAQEPPAKSCCSSS